MYSCMYVYVQAFAKLAEVAEKTNIHHVVFNCFIELGSVNTFTVY